MKRIALTLIILFTAIVSASASEDGYRKMGPVQAAFLADGK